MFLTMFFKTQNIGQTMHLTILIAHPYGLDNDDQEKVKMKKVKVETKKANVAPKPGLDNDDQEEKENCHENRY